MRKIIKLLYILFIQRKKNEQTSQTKLLSSFSVTLSFIYLLGSETANRINFMQHMLFLYSSCYFSSLEGVIRKVSNILTSENWFELVFILYKLVCQFIPEFSGKHRGL